MAQLFHSVTLDKDKCKGCINCIKRCPTQAIRVRDGKANIITDLCIDCGECIRICPHHAKKAITDPLSTVKQYEYPIALVPPSFYGQFNNIEDPDIVISALKKLGFKDVYDVGRAAELVSEATRQMLAAGKLKKPVISSACPAVTRLIRVRFPSLISRVLQLVAPVELAARMAKEKAIEEGCPEEDIGCIFLTPCPAKVTSIKMPIGTQESLIDAAVAVKDIYPPVLAA
ncbi:4Fe-4S binding protein, partial [Ruminococcaceae bacterium OttesenSCG-928-I18]|nr:4Fe-4S binding protein [Ruminococcaceae bacterium OttesenSCG-928-I18]